VKIGVPYFWPEPRSPDVESTSLMSHWGLTQPDNVTKMDYNVHAPAWALSFQKTAHKSGATRHARFPDHTTA
jgi:hypothetical protein